MQLTRLLRTLLAIALGLLSLLLLVVLLYLTDSVLTIWERLQRAPIWFTLGYSALLMGLAIVTGWLMWRILWPRHQQIPTVPVIQAPPTEAELQQRLATAEADGIDITAMRQELAKLQERRAAGTLYVSMFGEISSGKSSLIKALLPWAQVDVSPRGGTTRTINEYRWRSGGGDELVLVDVPGTNEVGMALDDLARSEAQRAHVVLYVCDGDLSRSQWEALHGLLELHKPCILVLNKTDRYTIAELELLKTRLGNRLDAFPMAELANVQSGGMQEAIRVLPDGKEEIVMRPIPCQVDELKQTLQQVIDEAPHMLEQLRDTAVFSLVADHLDAAESDFRRRKADELIDDYTRKAMLGAMAAVAPGADLLIQGYLGLSLVRSLADLYKIPDIPVHKANRQRLLELVRQQVGQTMPLTLAVAGNVLKAFPGVGTVTGGLLHAVAYGLIFRSLGRAVALSFATRGALHPLQTARIFKETLGEEIEGSSREMAQLALRLAHQKSITPI